ncbi:MAG: VanW family protein [Oscillospiraceae bacterium]|nr:VanW family protein [Oscillospiraceae bacterium]
MPQAATKRKASDGAGKKQTQKGHAPSKAPSKREETASSRRKHFLTPFGISMICVGVLLIAFVSFSVYALTYSRVFPNLKAYGIDFGGMTKQEAEAALTEKLADVYRGKEIILSLDEQSVTITAEEAGVALSPATTAETIYNKGRTGGRFSRIGFAFSSLFSQHTVEDDIDVYIDRGAIEQIVSSLSVGLGQPPVEYTWNIGGESIEVSGGQDGISSDMEEMTNAVIAGFKTQDFSPLSFQSEFLSPDPLPLEELYRQIYVEPKDAYITADEDNQTSVVPHVIGVSFDMQNALSLLEQKSGRFIIPLLRTAPDVTAADLEENLFRDLLGEYSTSTAGSSSNRVNNINLTAQYMTGTVVLPGEEFSFNQVVGNRTEERGFKMAGAYLNGRIVEAIGGGVCQSSTTLYNAVLLSNLHIVYRQNHSMTVAYVPLGLDAAVDWGRIDFVFSNDTAYPIRVDAWYASSRIHIQIWGTKTDDLTVSIDRDVIAHKPKGTKTEVNPDLAPGATHTVTSGSDGWTVQTYRVLKDPDGNVVYRNTEARSAYMKVDAIIEVGPGGGSELPDDGGTGEEIIINPSPDPDPSLPPDEPEIPDPTDTTETSGQEEQD